MPNYQFRLKLCDRDAGENLEQVVAEDDEEARSLAELRLLMTHGVAEVAVLRSGVELLALNRNHIGDGQSTAPSLRGPAAKEGQS